MVAKKIIDVAKAHVLGAKIKALIGNPMEDISSLDGRINLNVIVKARPSTT